MKFNLSSFLQWKVNLFLYNTLSWKVVFLYINVLGKLYFLIKKDEKQRVKDAIEAVFAFRTDGDVIKSITKAAIRGVMCHYYEKLYNILSSSESIEAFVLRHIHSKSLEAIEDGLSRGKGVLLVTGHFGGVELIPAFLNINGYPITIIARFSSDRFRDITAKKARQFAAEIIDADNTPNIVQAIKEHLNRNRIVVTLCDEVDEWRPSRKQALTFLGKHINLDRTVNILAKRCGTTLVFAIMHRVNCNQYEFTVNSCKQMAKEVNNSESMSVGEVVLKSLEKFIYKYPEEWYQWKKYPAIETVPKTVTRTSVFGSAQPINQALA